MALLNTDEVYVSAQPFEYLSQYATFDSVADMDENVEEHIAAHYYDLTDSERETVYHLASRALAYPGACHLKAQTIADNVGVSTKTVYRSVKKLTELGIIEKVPGTKLNGIKGASIYRILPNVPSEVSQRETVDKTSNDTVSKTNNENQSLDSFNLLRSKQASNIICLGDKLKSEMDKKKEYMNEYQLMLYDFMHSLPLRDDLKDEMHKVVLASPINNPRDFVRAKDVLLNIVRDINSGVLTISSTLRAVFVGAYDKAVERSKKMVSKLSVTGNEPTRVKPVVPFYNWLEIRE